MESEARRVTRVPVHSLVCSMKLIVYMNTILNSNESDNICRSLFFIFERMELLCINLLS